MSEAVDNLVIRAATAVDVPAVVQMIGAVFDEYRFVYEPAIEVPDILTLETTYAAPHVFFVGVADGVVVGSVGVKRYPPNAAEIKRLYLAAAQRGKGWGRRLLEWSIGWAQAQHVQTITAWSDTRFTDAIVCTCAAAS
ncbi:MAG: GNAT family N-acetyltransferase, partial [Chloroflexaceae bacterium]|nr:GNAT family N-acetyltransferase [Chloroflexaceae bacterium]